LAPSEQEPENVNSLYVLEIMENTKANRKRAFAELRNAARFGHIEGIAKVTDADAWTKRMLERERTNEMPLTIFIVSPWVGTDIK
jgi:hypothetical protein